MTLRRSEAANADRSRLGTGPADRDAVRVRASGAIRRERSSEIEDMNAGVITVNFLQTGFSPSETKALPSGVLEAAIDRLLKIDYRAWALAHPVTGPDRPDDWFADQIAALIGLDVTAFDPKLTAAELFTGAHRIAADPTADGVAALGRHLTAGESVEVVDLTGNWLKIPKESRSVLGGPPGTSSLGTAILGDRVPAASDHFTVRIGPMPIERFRKLLPGTALHDRLILGIRRYTGPGLGFTLKLIAEIGPDDTPVLGPTTLLGWTAWLGSRDGQPIRVELDVRSDDSR
jgi:type VI secretion system protein ImpH